MASFRTDSLADNTSVSREFTNREFSVRLGHLELSGYVNRPKNVRGIVLFLHSSGSSRFSMRNQFIAYQLNQAEFATCLVDLMTEEEQNDRLGWAMRFDISLLAKRLSHMTDWMVNNLEGPVFSLPEKMPLGYFGIGTGAAVALQTAADRPELLKVLVSWDGELELAESILHRIEVPVLMMIGTQDHRIIQTNTDAYETILIADKKLIMLPETGRFFETPEKLEPVAEHALEWFVRHCK